MQLALCMLMVRADPRATECWCLVTVSELITGAAAAWLAFVAY